MNNWWKMWWQFWSIWIGWEVDSPINKDKDNSNNNKFPSIFNVRILVHEPIQAFKLYAKRYE